MALSKSFFLPFKCYGVSNYFFASGSTFAFENDVTIGRVFTGRGGTTNHKSAPVANVSSTCGSDNVDTVSSITVKDCDCACDTTFLFGSIQGGKNVRIDPATSIDPSMFIDSKFFDIKPYDYFTKKSANEDTSTVALSANDIISSIVASSYNLDDDGDMRYGIKTLNNDGIQLYSGGITGARNGWVTIHAADDSFYLGVDGNVYFKQANGQYKTDILVSNTDSLILKYNKFELKNSTELGTKLLGNKVIDDVGNTTFYIKPLIEGTCVKFIETDEYIKLMYDSSCKPPCDVCLP